ncbi:FAD-binding protein [Spirosoma fluviale]|uniref:FAD/FMN-containing dehydrogenase n=1 Tax=Spirosoma fluviale TaxID=1597977 RepID=A0A286GI91_9BACT|nr:FAD-binding protein [Spirosoma fluviale]SOD95238.1 FAD/FMN-containing dehydrogenase [Spirosoma fluviale]
MQKLNSVEAIQRPTRHPLVYQFDPSRRCWLTDQDTTDPCVPVPQLDGTLLTKPEDIKQAASDFGHLIHRVPLAILRPASVDDVINMVRFANQFNIRIAGRGNGHTAFGQAQAEAGLIIDMRSLCLIHLIEADQVLVDAGVLWRDLLQATTAVGLTPPVVPDYTNLTVGGTLSVGGVSGRSFRYGAQVDQVIELQVVTGQGELLTCSAQTQADLFYGVLAGLGLCALIVRARITLIPARQYARTYRFFFQDVVPMLTALRQLTTNQAYDYIRGNGMPLAGDAAASSNPASPSAIDSPAPFVYFLEATIFYDTIHQLPTKSVSPLASSENEVQQEDRSYFEFTDQVVQLLVQLDAAGLGQLPHPWLDLFIPDSGIDAFVSQTIARLDPANFLPGSLLLFYPFDRKWMTCPLLRTPAESQFFLFDILRTLPADASIIQSVLAENRHLYEQNRAMGGFPYTISAIPMTSGDWMDHFGAFWPQLNQLKRQFDPKNVLGAGLSVFDQDRSV